MPEGREPTPPPPAASSAWTFETLAEADRRTLEDVLRGGSAPKPERLSGWVYSGLNRGWVTVISGEKFKKGFRRQDGDIFGYNELVHQDHQDHRGKWQVKLRRGRPVRLGHFRVSLVKDQKPRRLNRRYRHLGHFGYDVPMNGLQGFFFRVIRDFVALPNPGDHSLMLGKAYLRLGPLNIFCCHFLLGHREKIEDGPARG